MKNKILFIITVLCVNYVFCANTTTATLVSENGDIARNSTTAVATMNSGGATTVTNHSGGETDRQNADVHSVKFLIHNGNKPPIIAPEIGMHSCLFITSKQQENKDCFISLDSAVFANLVQVIQDVDLINKLSDTVFVGELVSLCEKQESDEETTESAGAVPFWLIIVLAVMFVAIVAFVVIYVKDKKNRKEDILSAVLNSDRIKRLIDEEAGKVAKNQPVPQAKSYDIEIRDIKSRIADLEDSKRQSRKEESQRSTPQVQQQSQKLYAQSIIDNKLHRVTDNPNEDTIFELNLRGNSKADITLYKPAYEKIISDSNFLDGCDKQVVGNSPSSVKVESLGEAVKDQDGFWIVTRKLNVTMR